MRPVDALYIEYGRGAFARGNLVPDAHIAALMRTHGVRTITHDRDFRKFPGIEVMDPFT